MTVTELRKAYHRLDVDLRRRLLNCFRRGLLPKRAAAIWRCKVDEARLAFAWWQSCAGQASEIRGVSPLTVAAAAPRHKKGAAIRRTPTTVADMSAPDQSTLAPSPGAGARFSALEKAA